MRLEINYRKKKNYKEHKYMEAKQCILNNQEITEEIKKEAKKNASEQMKMKKQ